MGTISIKKRHSIRKDEAAALMADLQREIGPASDLFRSDRIEKVETDSPFTLFLINRQPVVMKYETWTFPTIRGALLHTFSQRRITVDKGAIPFVINGADIMRPGITTVTDDVRAGAPVLIVEEGYGKPIAVGIALQDGPELLKQPKGKMVRTIHYVGDLLWKMEL
ncbi:MAG: RNA-binding protein [Methanomicrobiales archaeon]|nr:RNA-binding protein [Methanomicrobiales archaeon]